MKRKSDPRHKNRQKTVKKLFEQSFRPDLETKNGSDTEQVLKKQKDIDILIKKYAPSWPLEQIAPIDLATLRMAVWELKFKKEKVPYKVIVDEAVEIAKEYGTETSGSFVNGVLGSIIKSTKIPKESL